MPGMIIEVIYHFRGKQIAPKHNFKHQTMLSDITPIPTGMGMQRDKNIDVAMLPYNTSPFPFRRLPPCSGTCAGSFKTPLRGSTLYGRLVDAKLRGNGLMRIALCYQWRHCLLIAFVRLLPVARRIKDTPAF
jgi:hypothetical protein